MLSSVVTFSLGLEEKQTLSMYISGSNLHATQIAWHQEEKIDFRHSETLFPTCTAKQVV